MARVKTDPADAFQLPARKLITYEDLRDRVARWSAMPSARVERAGVSLEGRDIHLVILEPARGARGGSLPVLFCGGSFGFEAAHVEAQVALIERLLDPADREARRARGNLTVLVMPMPNPDGRVAAIRQWRRFPRSPGFAGCGNAAGFVLNRDFFALTQPETRAMHRVYAEWWPAAVIDSHEDMFSLGVSRPEVCWAPPYARPYHPALPREAIAAIDRLGAAIARAWQEHGYNFLYDPGRRRGLLSLFGVAGRLNLACGFRGIPTVVTESARTPGTQSWNDRVRQKVEAYLACLAEISAHPGLYRKKADMTQRETRGAVLLTPGDSDPLATTALARLLAMHGVRVLPDRARHRAFIIPLNQPRAPLVRALLGRERWNTASLAPAYGVKTRWMETRLPAAPKTTPRVELPTIREETLRALSHAEWLAVPNSWWGVALVNAALKHGIPVRWVQRAAGTNVIRPGTFLLRNIRGAKMAAALAGKIGLLAPARPRDGADLLPLRRVRVALYADQGVDEQHAVHLAEERWGLSTLGFDFVEVSALEVARGVLARFDVLVVPGGHAEEIVKGWDRMAFVHRPPWQTPGRPRGLGRQGLARIRAFVRRGGGYVGIGAGGGTLACDHLHILDARVVCQGVREGVAVLRARDPSHLVTLGLGERFEAYYYSEPAWYIHGAPIFAARGSARNLATFERPEKWRSTDHWRLAEMRRDLAGGGAILAQDFGRGRVVVMAVNPNFRATWLRTAILLSNAIWHVARVRHP
ncbi:MAG: hypothetical protein HY660_14120 [Armatimonadetes bacterium]|nr:hypothetical protein [Armatimonadota bacterium]